MRGSDVESIYLTNIGRACVVNVHGLNNGVPKSPHGSDHF